MPRRKKSGKRTRFNGFVLTTSKRDRVIATWINAQPNAAESIKALIYAEATGRFRLTVAPAAGTQDAEADSLNPADPRVQTLAALDT